MSFRAPRFAQCRLQGIAVEGEMATIVGECIAGPRVDQPVDEGIFIAGDRCAVEPRIAAFWCHGTLGMVFPFSRKQFADVGWTIIGWNGAGLRPAQRSYLL